MKPPRLSRRLQLERPAEEPDGAGGQIRSWVTLGALWADFSPGSGRLEHDEGLVRGVLVLRVITRAAPVGAESRPCAGQRFREGGRVWLILAVSEAEPDARYLTCHVREEVPV